MLLVDDIPDLEIDHVKRGLENFGHRPAPPVRVDRHTQRGHVRKRTSVASSVGRCAPRPGVARLSIGSRVRRVPPCRSSFY